jgi:hypothetical protein
MEIDFNEMGSKEREGKGSYIAVVHADGNGWANELNALPKNFSKPGDGNRAYINEIRKFSQDVNRATAEAVTKMKNG